MKKIAAGLALAALLGVTHARTVPLVDPERVALVSTSAALTPELVKQAIVRGGARFEWIVVNEQPGKIQLKYNKNNKHEVTVEVSYDSTGFQIRYISSINLDYSDKKGAPVIHSVYPRWLANLTRAISDEVATPPVAN